MNLLQALILGIVQGIAEWVPISSSGHLAIMYRLMGLDVPLLFDIFLHIASLLVIVVVFWKDIINMIKSTINFDFKSKYGRMALFVIIASVPTAIIGYLFNHLFREAFNCIVAICFGLIITSIFLLFSRLGKNTKKLRWYNSVVIGISQGLAILPGVSRSGSTISTALLMDIDRLTAFKFSFILAIPAIFGAMLNDFSLNIMKDIPLLPLLFSMIVTFVVGYVSLKFLIKLVLNNKFYYFAYYCMFLSLILLFLYV